MADRGVGTDRPPSGPPNAPAGRTRATVLLIALRFGYAYNWFDIGPALPRIGSTFAVGPAAWGLLVAGFLVGAGATQVPAGFLARRHGERPVALAGVGLLALAALAGAFSPSYAVLLATRVAAGIGAGLFFSPAIGWVGRLFGPGERGLPVGTFSSAFSAGAAAGVVGAALLVPAVGWQANLALGALGLGLTTAVAWAAIPRSAEGLPGPDPEPGKQAGAAWRSRSVVAVGIAFVGFEGATFATGQFVVPFGEVVRLWPAWLAGAVGSSFVLPSIVGGPVGGVVSERSMRHRTQLAGVTVVGAAALAALPLAGVAAAVAIGSVFSFAYGFAYAVMYVLPHYWTELPAREVPLAIGLFNAIQLGGGALVSALFGWVVASWSYAVGWEFVALVQVAALLALVAMRPTVGAHRPAEGASGPP
ncbi:MAG TPA: MFS transporter [Thermoplasmata archaeon]|nr:MFS transporter [Thermoplasmata archaeon]